MIIDTKTVLRAMAELTKDRGFPFSKNRYAGNDPGEQLLIRVKRGADHLILVAMPTIRPVKKKNKGIKITKQAGLHNGTRALHSFEIRVKGSAFRDLLTQLGGTVGLEFSTDGCGRLRMLAGPSQFILFGMGSNGEEK